MPAFPADGKNPFVLDQALKAALMAGNRPLEDTATALLETAEVEVAELEREKARFAAVWKNEPNHPARARWERDRTQIAGSLAVVELMLLDGRPGAINQRHAPALTRFRAIFLRHRLTVLGVRVPLNRANPRFLAAVCHAARR